MRSRPLAVICVLISLAFYLLAAAPRPASSGRAIASGSSAGRSVADPDYSPAISRGLLSLASPVSPAASLFDDGVSTLFDDFNDNALDSSKWVVAPANGVSVLEQNRRLEITPPASATGYNGYYSAPTVNLTNGRASVEVVQSTAPVYGIETYFLLSDSATGNYLLFATGGGNFLFQDMTNGAMSRAVIPYSASYRFWRFRHDATADQIVWETSADGIIWVAQRRAARGFSITALQVELIAGKYTASTPASAAVFDNLRVDPNPAPRAFFADDFNDNSRDASKWFITGPGSGVSVLEQNQRLEITPPATTTGYSGYCSNAAYNLTDAAASVEVVQATAQVYGIETYFYVSDPNTGNYLLFDAGGPNLLFQDYTNGVASRVAIPYSASQHRYWRIRHDAQTDTVTWETSADAVTWTVQRRIARPFPVTGLNVLLVAGKYTATTPASTAVFDNLRLEHNAPLLTPSDNFDDNSLDATKWYVTSPASPVAVAERNQRLELTLQPNTAGYNAVASTQPFDLTDKTLQTQVVQTASQGGWVETYFEAQLDGNNYYLMEAGAGSFLLQSAVGGVTDRTVVGFDANAYRYWRFRHNAAANTVNFEASADGKTWATLKTVAANFPATSIYAVMMAGAWGTGNGSPGAAIYDDLRLTPNDPNSPPTVAITSPANGATFTAPASVTVTADAADSDGTIAKVEFFSNGTKVGEDTTAPYSFTVTNASAGSYTLTARAIDSAGAVVTSAPVGITVAAANSSPTVSITSPANNAAFTAGDTVNIAADASDPDGTVAKVEFFSNGTKLGEDTTAPYSFAWANVAAGSYSLTAKATDNAGAVTTSNAVAVSVVPPTVTVSATDASASEQGTDVGVFTFSRTGSTAAPLTVNYTAGGTATAGVDYAALSGAVTIPAGASSQTVIVTPADDAVVEGDETVTATLAGNVNYSVGSPSSATVTIHDDDTYVVTVSATDASASEPGTDTGTFTFSRTGGTLSALTVSYALSGTATNGTDYNALSGTVTIPAGSASQTVTVAPVDDTMPEGDETVVLTLSSGAGYQAGSPSSATVTIHDNDNFPPTASITSPAAGQVFTAPASVTITANASDPDGTVSKVEFFEGSTKLGEAITAPYSFTWSNVPAGSSYSLTAKATDNAGATGTSAAVSIIVNAPPSVSVTGPAAGTVFTAPAGVTIDASASDTDGAISKVEFFQNGTLLGEDTSAPFSFTWAGTPAGTYSLTARATDDRGATGTSAAVSVVVDTPPSVSITAPADNAAFSDGSNITISATASDPDANDAIAKVEFYQGTTKLGEGTSAPYSFTWGNVPEGSYTLTAVATDGRGVSATSAAVRVSAVNFTAARLDPSNRTGSMGVDLVSRNFNWSLPLVSLPGRSGLDLGLSLSYNSLVWTKSGNYVLFDGDGGWPSPGFRLGFPVVQGKFADTQAGKNAYLMITPSGARVSLRQTAAGSTVYESGDSSYLQLRENQDGTLTVLTTGGMKMAYWPEGGVYKCTKVEDSNGNLITVAYNASGNVEAVTDTLGRVLTFEYYGDGYLKWIKQTWNREVESGGTIQTVTETHYWARFTYDDKAVRTNFAGLTVFGPSNGQTVHALQKVQLADDSAYTFDYTTWGQINKVTQLSPDGHALNYVSLNLPADETAAQGDCPRFTESRVWAAYWNGDADGVPATDSSEEAVTTYGPYNFASGAGKATAPDSTLYQETYETSGWKKGLVTRADEFSADDHQNPKKYTEFIWTQDDETLPYQQNPRVRQTDIYDSQGNHRRTDVVYTSFGLPSDVKEYDSTAQVVLRRTHTVYLPDSITSGGAYVNPDANPTLRIIGLPSERDVYGTEDGQEKLYSKLTYDYDLPNDNTTQFLSDAGAATQHDSAYGQSFTPRGNLCRVRRWDVTDAQNQSKAIVASEAGYNTAGSPVFSRDARSHTTTYAYTDSDGGARLAYPTKVTDPDTFSSTAEYNYDLGLVTRVVDPKGAAVKSFYDAAGRRLKVKSEVNGSYTTWEYGANGRYVKQLTKVDTDKAETFVAGVTDGAGRTLGALRELPSSVSGAYSAQRFEYDNVGRQVKQYNPTEVTVNTSDISDISSWQPAGADATANGGAGWAYSSREYDWKGRVRHEVAADRVTDRYTDYDGCGCAGGEVVTTRGEVVPIPGTSDKARRVNKVYSDSLGRPWKTEVYNWNGATVYSTTTVKYDALDHQVRVRRYAGPAPDPEPEADDISYQTSSMSYDGHGRLQSRHLPDQSAGTATAYTYFDDDMVKSVTDARGVKTSFAYNARHLVTAVTYDRQGLDSVATEKPGGSGTTPVTDTAALGLTYDEAGNRLTMNDGSGSTTYHYDTMSRLTSEDKQFAGLTGTTYTLSYQYALAGALKQVTDVSAGVSFSYDLDKVGQATAVNRTESGVSAQLAHDMQYRATGALKGMSYNNGTSVSLSYDVRGLVTHYGVGGVTQDGQYGALAHGSDFDYYADGRVKYASDLFTDALTTGLHDRAYSYDHAGRLQEAYSGQEANQLETGTASGGEGAFRQSYTYDAFGNTKGRTGRLWSADDNDTEPFVASGRNTAWEYDPDGRLVSRNETTQNGLTPYAPLRDAYDAAGRLYQTTQTMTSMTGPRRDIPHTATVTETETYDGAGLVVVEATSGTNFPSTTYYLRSTVLGGKAVSEYNGLGVRQVTHVLAGGAPIADSWNNTGTPYVNWKHVNPVTGDELDTDSNGAVTSKATLDPAGHNLGDSDPASDTTGGGDEGGTSQAQMNKMYAQTLPPSLGGDAVQAVDKAGFEFNAAMAFTLEAMGAGRVYFSSSTSPNGTFITFVNTKSVAQGNARTTRWAALTVVGNWIGYLPERAVFGHQDEDYYFSLDMSEIANPGSRNTSGVFSLSDLPGTLIGEGGFQGAPQNSGGITWLPGGPSDADKDSISKWIQGWVANKDCVNALKEAGLKDPNAVIEKGYILGTLEALHNLKIGPGNDITSFGQGQIESKFSSPDLSGGDAAVTTSNPNWVMNGKTLTIFSPNNFSSLGKTVDATNVAAVWAAAMVTTGRGDIVINPLQIVTFHEFLHALGAPSVPGKKGDEHFDFRPETYSKLVRACSPH